MGKRKIEIEKIENQERRMVAFSKRRQGLFNKAAHLCRLCDTQIAIIVLSPAGRVYSFGHSSVDDVIHRFLTREDKEDGENGGGFWWDNVNIDELDSIEKLQGVYNAMLTLKQNVSKRLEELNSSSSSAAAASCTEAATGTSCTTIVTAEEDCSLFPREGDDCCWCDNELMDLDELLKSLDNDDDDGNMLQLSPLFNGLGDIPSKNGQEDTLTGSPANALKKRRTMEHIT